MALERPDPYRETTDTIRTRLLRSFPRELSQLEGTWVRDVVETQVLEFTALWGELNEILAQTFPTFATGDNLERHAASYGVTRSLGKQATGTVRFTGAVGTGIGTATEVSAPQADPSIPRARFTTTNPTTEYIPVGGFVDIPVTSVVIGSFNNQIGGAVNFLDSPTPGVTAVTNPSATSGGADVESDEELRARVLTEAQLSTGPGTRLDYQNWSLEIDGVSYATVSPIWDTSGIDGKGTKVGNGTVAVSARGPNYVPLDWGKTEETQRWLDPSRQLIALLEEGEVWTQLSGTPVMDWNTTNVQTGNSALRLTGIQAAVIQHSGRMDLARFRGVDHIQLWVYSTNWANVLSTSWAQFSLNSTNYYRATFAQQDTTGGFVVKPTTGAGWWLWNPRFNQFTQTGTLTWADIASVDLKPDLNGSTAVTYDYWVAKGVGEGRAPVGVAVTVVTPVAKPINVTAAVEPAIGYSLISTAGSTNLTDIVRQNLTNFLISLGPGDPVRVVDVANVIHDTPGVRDFTLSAPATNTPVSANQYATLGVLTLTVL